MFAFGLLFFWVFTAMHKSHSPTTDLNLKKKGVQGEPKTVQKLSVVHLKLRVFYVYKFKHFSCPTINY